MNQSKLDKVKQEMARVNIHIFGISELKWTGMGKFNSDDYFIYYSVLNIQKTKIMASGPITSWQTDGETMETVTDFSWAPKSLQMVTAAMKLKDVCSF